MSLSASQKPISDEFSGLLGQSAVENMEFSVVASSSNKTGLKVEGVLNFKF